MLPHHSRPVARIAELVDQGGDHFLVARRPQQCISHRPYQVQVLDALSCPVGADLAARHAPHLLGVGLEEDLVEPPAEAVGHPLLEVAFLAVWREARAEVAQTHSHRFQGTQAEEGVHRLQRIVEELAPIVDAGEARTHQHFLVEDLVPQRFDLRQLAEEAVPPDVESIALVHRGPGDATHRLVLLEDDGRKTVSRQLIGSGQAPGSGTDDHTRGIGQAIGRGGHHGSAIGERIRDAGSADQSAKPAV